MLPVAEVVDAIAEQNGFAGVVSVDRGGAIEFLKAYGLADRAWRVPNTVDTRFALASGVKGTELSPGRRRAPRGGRRPSLQL